MRWVVKDTDGFAERYREARRAFVEALADDLVDDAREARGKDMPGVQAQRLITDTTKWLLSRIHPDCADRLQLGGPLAGNATIVVTLPAKGQPVTIDGTATEIEQQLLEDGSEG